MPDPMPSYNQFPGVSLLGGTPQPKFASLLDDTSDHKRIMRALFEVVNFWIKRAGDAPRTNTYLPCHISADGLEYLEKEFKSDGASREIVGETGGQQEQLQMPLGRYGYFDTKLLFVHGRPRFRRGKRTVTVAAKGQKTLDYIQKNSPKSHQKSLFDRFLRQKSPTSEHLCVIWRLAKLKHLNEGTGEVTVEPFLCVDLVKPLALSSCGRTIHCERVVSLESVLLSEIPTPKISTGSTDKEQPSDQLRLEETLPEAKDITPQLGSDEEQQM